MAAASGSANGASGDANGEAPKEKPKRGKPKDASAPPKPRNGFTKFGIIERARLKETRPELISDLSGMGKALAEGWAAVPEAEKEAGKAVYEKEMEIWKPLWEEYKKTRHYKDFVEIKTDYLDIRAKKKLQKTMTKDAPKRPRSGYMIFGGEVREKVMEEVKAKGLGLGDAGKMISERWQAISEAEKARYGEISQQQKVTFDVEFAKYRVTKSFADFQEAKAKLEAKQGLKKIARVNLDGAPNKAPSGFALYRREVLPQICAANKKAKESEPPGEVLGMADIARKVASMYKALTDEQKVPYNEGAAAAKIKYEKDLLEFKTDKKYTNFLEKRSTIKQRENRLLRLRELPKRPKGVFAMFCQDNKDKVPAGKGEGKGRNALKTLFETCPEDKKAEYKSKEAEQVDAWKKDLEAFKSGETFKTYQEMIVKVKAEFENEIIKVTTLKFLTEAPKPPPRTGFAIFVGEKRKREEGGEKQSKAQKKEEMEKLKKEWIGTDRAVKTEYDGRKNVLFKQFTDDCNEYMKSEKWQEYQKEAKRLRIPVRHLLLEKKKVQKKFAKGEKIPPSAIPLPTRPDSYPTDKPRSARAIFAAGKTEPFAEVLKMWEDLDAEGKAKYTKEAADEVKFCAEQADEFRKSPEGKRYVQELRTAQNRRKVLDAKNRFLDDMPVKPENVVKIFQREKLVELKSDQPGKKGFEYKKILDDMWKGLSDEDRQKYNGMASEKEKKFKEDMDAFKLSDNYRKYQAAVSGGSGAIGGPKKPASFPKPPLGAFELFKKDESNQGKSADDLTKLWGELEKEKREELDTQAKEGITKYQEDVKEWNKGPDARRWAAMKTQFGKRKQLAIAKSKYMKDEPKKPRTSYDIFFEDKKDSLKESHPDVKGTADIKAKLTGMWKELSTEDKAEFDAKGKEAQEQYAEAMKEFHNSDNYKKWQQALRRSSGGAPKAKGKGKGSGPVESGPKAPAGMPKAPPKTPMIMFMQKLKAEGKSLKIGEVAKEWTALGAEGQKPHVTEQKEQMEAYKKEMEEFNKGAEGKKYVREKANAVRKGRLDAVRKKYLGGSDAPKEPKRPQSAYFMFCGEKRSEIQKENPDLKMGDIAKKMAEAWKTIEAGVKKGYEQKYQEEKKEYDKLYDEYKNSDKRKMYDRAVKSITGGGVKKAQAKKMVKAKAKASSGGGARKGPAAKKAAAKDSDDDSDVMGSDSDSSSSDSDSD